MTIPSPLLPVFLPVSCCLAALVLPAGAEEPEEPEEPEEKLPVGSHPPALEFEHFPSALHAVVWRNWNLVPAARLAEALGGTAEEVEKIARSMGLPRPRSVPASWDESLYITILRRNWHLLPYDQILTLLDRSADGLAFSLKEDDFLFHKLGNLKPKCGRVVFREPTAKERERAATIRRVVEAEFPDGVAAGEAPLAFVEELSRPPKGGEPVSDAVAAKAPARPGESGGGLRYLHSYFGVFGDPLLDPELDPFPEGLLHRLADHGVNGVWLHVVLHQLAPEGGVFPEFGEKSEARLARLRELVDRAADFGIEVHLYVNEPRAMPPAFFEGRPGLAGGEHRGHVALCTSTEEVRAWLRESLAHVFSEVPGLGGVFTITVSENFTNCVSKGKTTDCPRCSDRPYAEVIAEVNRTIAEGVWAGAPEAKVIVWDWGWNRHGDGTAIIERLPRKVWFQSVSEWAKPFSRGGYDAEVGEYSISVVGPGPRALRHWEVARERGLETVAKVQFNNTWELSAVPWLPVMDLIAEHAANLADRGVKNYMLSWTLGGYPSPNLEIADAFARNPDAEPAQVLDGLAERRYGPEAVEDVRRAWAAFSEAFQEFPYSGGTLYLAPQQYGPSNLLYRRPTGYAASMIGFPYDDLDRWKGGYTEEAFVGQFETLAAGWEEGLALWDRVVDGVAPQRAEVAREDGRLARAAGLHFASVAHQCRFVMARDEMLEEGKWNVTPAIRAILDSEIRIARELHALASADSRIGYEASNHYYYRPRDLVEKVVQCRWLRDSDG